MSFLCTALQQFFACWVIIKCQQSGIHTKLIPRFILTFDSHIENNVRCVKKSEKIKISENC